MEILSGSRAKRVTLVYRICSSTGLWSAPCWTVNCAQLSKIRRTLNVNIKRYLRLHRMVGWTPEQYCHAQNSACRTLKKDLQLIDLDVQAARRLFRYAGHIARRSQYDADCLISQVLKWNCHQTCLEHKQNCGTQGHPQRYAPWHWEGQFTRYFKDSNWLDLAQDKKEWRSLETPWIKWLLGKTLAQNAVW